MSFLIACAGMATMYGFWFGVARLIEACTPTPGSGDYKW